MELVSAMAMLLLGYNCESPPLLVLVFGVGCPLVTAPVRIVSSASGYIELVGVDGLSMGWMRRSLVQSGWSGLVADEVQIHATSIVADIVAAIIAGSGAK